MRRAARIIEMSNIDERVHRIVEARLEALELELERAHRRLDEYGVPREFRQPGVRDPIEYSLEARLRLVLDEEDE